MTSAAVHPADEAAHPTFDLDQLLDTGVVLAEGGFGRVYGCRDAASGRAVAVKTGDGVAREADILRTLRRTAGDAALEHIVRMWGVARAGATGGPVTALVLERADTSLDKVLARSPGGLGAPAVAHVVRCVATAVDAMGRAGMSHADLKPSNILVSGTSIRVTDFGSAGLSGVTAAKYMTQGYRTPEDLVGVKELLPSARVTDTDIWCLGVLALQCLLGRNPFDLPAISSLYTMCLVATPPFPATLPSLSDEQTSMFHELSLAPRPQGSHPEHELLQSSPLVASLLHLTPVSRPTPAEVLAHPYCADAAPCALTDAAACGGGAQGPDAEDAVLCDGVTPPRGTRGCHLRGVDVTPPAGAEEAGAAVSSAGDASGPRSAGPQPQAAWESLEPLSSEGAMRRL